ncbi:hypothetical protein D3C81_1264800 [compost metagenome]
MLDRGQQAFDGLRNYTQRNRQRALLGYHTVHLNRGIVRQEVNHSVIPYIQRLDIAGIIINGAHQQHCRLRVIGSAALFQLLGLFLQLYVPVQFKQLFLHLLHYLSARSSRCCCFLLFRKHRVRHIVIAQVIRGNRFQSIQKPVVPGIKRHIARLVALRVINELLQLAFTVNHDIGYPVQMVDADKLRVDFLHRKSEELGEPLLKTDRRVAQAYAFYR